MDLNGLRQLGLSSITTFWAFPTSSEKHLKCTYVLTLPDVRVLYKMESHPIKISQWKIVFADKIDCKMCCIFIKFYEKGGCHGHVKCITFVVFFQACRKGWRSCDLDSLVQGNMSLFSMCTKSFGPTVLFLSSLQIFS